MSTIDDNAANTRICGNCAEQKKITEFRRRRRGASGRENKCRTCHNASERLRRAAKKDKAVANFVKALAGRRNINQIVFMARVVIRSFGGSDGFAREWRRQKDRAMAEDPKTAFRFLMATIRLMELADRLDR